MNGLRAGRNYKNMREGTGQRNIQNICVIAFEATRRHTMAKFDILRNY